MEKQEQYRETIEYLLHWYDYNQRILPWRQEPTPYHVWISEIMLQQTRVEAVRGYYVRFLDVLPTIKDLAEAEEEKLLKLWEGLGYYSRVRNLKKAAQVVVSEYGGELPADYHALLSLPGIGSYTAGAIASIAFGLAEPAVDGNVLRVMNRITGSFDDITKASIKKEMEENLRAVMPKDRPGDYNQSLMELGATVCIPNGKPLCAVCPVMHLCKAYKEDTWQQIPVKAAPKKAREIFERTIFVFCKRDHAGKLYYAVRKRGKRGLLAGLWEFPGIEEKLPISGAEAYLERAGCPVLQLTELGEAKHIFSHLEWHMAGYLVELGERSEQNREWFEEKADFSGQDFRVRESEDYGQSGLDAPKEKPASQENSPFSNLRFVESETLKREYSLPSAFEAYKRRI